MLLKLQLNKQTQENVDYLLIHLVSPPNTYYKNFQNAELKESYHQHLYQ